MAKDKEYTTDEEIQDLAKNLEAKVKKNEKIDKDLLDFAGKIGKKVEAETWKKAQSQYYGGTDIMFGI